jgi:uncharacterized protein DUF6502
MTEARSSDQHKKLECLLGAVFTVCSLDRTLSKSKFDLIIRDARALALVEASRLQPKRRLTIDYDLIGHVIYLWQRSPLYLNENGKPFPIPARGPAPSIEALFKQLRATNRFRSHLTHLQKLRRIQKTRTNRFVPRLAATIIPTLTPEVLESLTQTIHNLVATVLQNTSTKGNSSLRLIERAAFVPDLPMKQVEEFKEFARAQAGGLLETVNDWLEGQRGRAARKPNAPRRVAAGLHVFAFVKKQAK